MTSFKLSINFHSYVLTFVGILHSFLTLFSLNYFVRLPIMMMMFTLEHEAEVAMQLISIVK